MFRRSERKIKAVFKMHFQATQVPPVKAKGIILSLVPVDVGKPSVKLAKAQIIDGTCTWENPIYETVKFVQEIKTGIIREKFYYLILSTGSSKSGFLGEVSIDFADLVESTKPQNLILPLQTSKSGAILQVTVERIRDPSSRFIEDNESPTADPYEECFDTELRDCYSYGKRGTRSPDSEHSSEAIRNEQNASLGDAESDSSDAKSRDGMTKTPHDKLGELTNQVKMLERKAEVAEMEVQSLRQQIIKEGKKGQKLAEQIANLKQEKDALQAECELLKSSPNCKREDETSIHTRKVDKNMSTREDISHGLAREKQLNKKLKLQLQETEDSNSEYVIALRDLTQKLEQKNLEISKLSSEIKSLHMAPDVLAAVPREKMDRTEKRKALDGMVNYPGDNEIVMLKQNIEELNRRLEIHMKEKTEMQMKVKKLTLDYGNLESENKDTRSALQQNQKEKIEMQQNYSESLAQMKQLKLNVASLEQEVKRQEIQHSASLNVIDEFELQVENLQNELENQARVFEEDLDAVTQIKIEHEQRAIRAEEAFRKMRRNNANAAERLQEEFKRLSADMSLKVEENEKLAQKSISEANDLRLKNELLEEQFQRAEEECKIKCDEYERLLHEIQEQNKGMLMHEKEYMEREVAPVREEVEKLLQQNSIMQSQIDKMKTNEENLQLELKMLRQKNSEMKNDLLQVQMEKEQLKKEKPRFLDGYSTEKGQEKSAPEDFIGPPSEEESGIEAHIILTNHTDELKQETAPAEDINDRVVGGISKSTQDLPGTNKNDTEENKRSSYHHAVLEEKSDHSIISRDVSSLLSEVSSLKGINKSMEEGLKEMHERYTEISLRFAEVEGERQQLVMALRNLKSVKKN